MFRTLLKNRTVPFSLYKVIFYNMRQFLMLIMSLNFSGSLKPEQFQSYHHASLGAIKSGIYDSILHVNLESASQFLQI
jgi:hypothetical protein